MLQKRSAQSELVVPELGATPPGSRQNRRAHKDAESGLTPAAPVAIAVAADHSGPVKRAVLANNPPATAAPIPLAAKKANPIAAKPILTEAQSRWLRLQQECRNAPRTPARLQADLDYGLAATDAWSNAFKVAFADMPKAAVTLMQVCSKFDSLPEPKSLPSSPPPTSGVYTIAEIKLRADQTMRNFWVMPSSKNVAAYRDYRALQRLGVPLGARIEGQLASMRELVRLEVLSEYESESIVLAGRIKR